ncbi:FHA domain-containing protein [Clostridium hydrogenum]|uniref:FHA domain-containing protein n=1 Tax=Clostridium hydrogenum TaxID=2855764 RepID=UPI001F3410F7|nr:FHA domain-containing protein [Clostridium hydrogenum]
MSKVNFIKDIEFSNSNYIELVISPDSFVDDYQFSVVNSSGNNLINCIKDKYKANCLLYYVESYIPLKNFILKNVFSIDEFKKIVEQIVDLILWIKEHKLITSNLIIDIKYLFIDVYSHDIKFMYVPVSSNDYINSSMENLGILLRQLVNSSQIKGGEELVGFILSKVNDDNFDINNFKNKISSFNKNDDENSSRFGKFKGFIISFFIIIFLCICIPLIGNAFKIKLISKYIDYNALIVFSILFFAAELISFIIVCFTGNKKSKEEEVYTNLKSNMNYEKQRSKEDIYIARKSEDNNKITNSREYSPVIEDEFDLNSRKLNKESVHSDLDKENGTSVLFSDNSNKPYIIKLNSEGTGKIYIDKAAFNIGRDKVNSDFVIEKPTVSGKHASIVSDNGEYYIIDNNSSNGTYLNHIKLEPNKRYRLNNKDGIIFADESYYFYLN